MQQARHGISDPEAALPIGSQTQRPPGGTAQLKPLSLCVGSQNGAAVEAGVESALRITGHVFGGSADRHLGDRRERLIGREDAG